MDATTRPASTGKKIWPIEFKGQAGEFFGIWFVNACINMMTFGLYGPWAKVRTFQYFYGNTSLADGHFQFTADPRKMFLSRLIATGLFILFFIADLLATEVLLAGIVYAAMVIVYFLIVPIILVLFMSFRLRHSSWRGIAFRFKKDYAGAYRVYLAPIAVIALIVASLILPFTFSDHTLRQENEVVVMTGADMDPAIEATMADADEGMTADSEEMLDDPLAQLSDEELATMSDEQIQAYIDEYDAQFAEEYEDEEDSVSFKDIDPVYFLPALFFTVLLVLLIPYFDFINSRFLARNTRFGTARISFLAGAATYYRMYGKWVFVSLLLAAAWVVFSFAADYGVDIPVFSDNKDTISSLLILASVLYGIWSKAYFAVRRYNILMNNIGIEEDHRLQARATVLPYIWLMISNFIGIMITFGLLKAWAMVRTARFFLIRTSLQSSGNLDEFVAAQEEKINALAEEGVDVFDLDLV